MRIGDMHRMSFSLTHLYVLYNTFLKIRSMLCCDVYYYCTCLLVTLLGKVSRAPLIVGKWISRWLSYQFRVA